MPTKVKRRAQRKPATNKQLAIEAIRKLPDAASLMEIADEIAMLNSIEEGLKAADAGDLIPHEEVVRQVQEWLSK
jgi:predicted transcriptional regulator